MRMRVFINELIDALLKKNLLRALRHLGVVESEQYKLMKERMKKNGSHEVRCKF